MEVHPPHEPIRTVKEFFLHLFTITIGLLIAVGIEGIVEWRHHEHLVNEANATLHEEVRYNSQRMNEEVQLLNGEQREIQADLHALKKIQDQPSDVSAQNPSLVANFRNMGLHETAWNTAQSTGALGYMPYSEAQRYAEIYQQQASFLSAQRVIGEDQANLLGLIAKFDLAESSRISIERAAALAECFGRWRAHLLYLHALARLNAATYDAFLKNKPGPTEMHEDGS